MNYRILFGVWLTTALFFLGCSQKQTPAPDSGSERAGVMNLGVVELTDGKPAHRDLGGGNACVITPTMLKDGSVELAIAVEKSGKILATPRVSTLPDRAVQITVGDIQSA